MRTTIDIPDILRQKLALEAISKNLKGFSEIIVEALNQYFESGQTQRKKIVRNLKGCLSEKEYTAEMKSVKEARSHWRQ